MPVSDLIEVAKGGFSSLKGQVDHIARARIGDLARLIGGLNDEVTTLDGEVTDLDGRVTDLEGGPTGPIVQVFTSDTDWTKPADLSHIVVEVVGGGGASGGAPASTAGNTAFGQAGAGGGYARKLLLASELADTEPVTVGAGGAGASGAAGSAGGTSQFGDGSSAFTAVAATGGSPGGILNPAATGNHRTLLAVGGGSGSGGDVNGKGGTGGPLHHTGGGSIGSDNGQGGESVFGAGGGFGLAANGNPGITPGSGGGGVRNANATVVRTGGAGADGIVIVTEYFSLGVVVSSGEPEAQTWNNPFHTGVTIGDGTLVANYVQVGDVVHCDLKFTLGSTSSINSEVTVDVPVTPAVAGSVHGDIEFLNAGVQRYFGRVFPGGTTEAYLRIINTSSTYAQDSALSSTAPFSWGVGDSIALHLEYRLEP